MKQIILQNNVINSNLPVAVILSIAFFVLCLLGCRRIVFKGGTPILSLKGKSSIK